jgi:hypothetical protein
MIGSWAEQADRTRPPSTACYAGVQGNALGTVSRASHASGKQSADTLDSAGRELPHSGTLFLLYPKLGDMMRYFRLLGIAVAALFALGVAMVGSASAALLLPEVVITLTGGTYPIHLDVTILTLSTSLSNETEKLSGKGFLLLYLALELTSLGSFAALFLNVLLNSTTSCHSAGDPAGEVLTHGTWHLVYTSLNVNGQPLGLGVLHLVSPLSVECGSLIIKIRGNALAPLTPPTTGQLTQLTGTLTGNGTGKPTTPTAYYNDEGQVKKAKLEANFGSGFLEAAEETGTVTVVILLLATQMFEIEQPNP